MTGFDRQRRTWAAGIRTHMLVCVGACLVMIVSAFGFSAVLEARRVVLDPSRVAAQVVSGIGFIGGGSILLRGHVVRGLTTAASIWTVAAIGLAVGAGLYFAAFASTAMFVGIPAGVKPLDWSWISYRSCWACSPVGSGNSSRVLLSLIRVSSSDVSRCVERLRDSPGIHRVTVEKSPGGKLAGQG